MQIKETLSFLWTHALQTVTAQPNTEAYRRGKFVRIFSLFTGDLN